MSKITFYILFVMSAYLLTSCRGEDYVDRSKSTNYYYSKDKTEILYDSTVRIIGLFSKLQYSEVTNDVTNFEVLTRNFAKDSKHIYYTNIKLSNVDLKSFYWDDVNKVPKDAKHVYLPKTNSDILPIVQYADPKTYEKIDLGKRCLNWYKDKNHYFFNHKKTDADRDSLNFDSPFFPFDKTFIFYIANNYTLDKDRYIGKIEILNANLVHDNKHLYFNAGCDSTTKRISFVDINTFVYLDQNHHIFKIDSLLYFKGILMSADAQSYEILQYPYGRDKDKVLYKNIILPGSDPQTFEIMNHAYSKDKNHVYRDGTILRGYNPKNFTPDKWGRYPTDSGYGKEPKKNRDDD